MLGRLMRQVALAPEHLFLSEDCVQLGDLRNWSNAWPGEAAVGFFAVRYPLLLPWQLHKADRDVATAAAAKRRRVVA